MKKNSIFIFLFIICFFSCLMIVNALYTETINNFTYNNYSIPKYNGKPCQSINNNIPRFSILDISKSIFEKYSSLDTLNRVGVAFSKINYILMPTIKNENNNLLLPSGWKQAKYSIIPGNWLYNRCHLIAYQLTGEATNKNNIFTCTYYLNHNGMMKYENMVSKYLKKSKRNRVLYRVTPVFQNNNLLATGVIMEGLSLDYKSIIYNVFCYNLQPGVLLDYSNGNSKFNSSKNITKPIKEVIINIKKHTQSLNIQCKKIKNVKYQFAYKKSSSKNYIYNNSNISKISIKNLKENTYYKVKVRAYKNVNGEKIYGPWSNIKKIKTNVS